MNKVILKGRLVREPEFSTTNSGISKAKFTMATDGFGKDAEADFHQVTVWRQTADFVKTYITKGQEILLEGSMRSGKYDNDEGKTIYTYEVMGDRIEFCGSKQDNHAGDNAPAHTAAVKPTPQPAPQPVKPEPKLQDVPWDLDL